MTVSSKTHGTTENRGPLINRRPLTKISISGEKNIERTLYGKCRHENENENGEKIRCPTMSGNDDDGGMNVKRGDGDVDCRQGKGRTEKVNRKR